MEEVWLFERIFDIGVDTLAYKHREWQFMGLDTEAAIIFNGRSLSQMQNAFRCCTVFALQTSYTEHPQAELSTLCSSSHIECYKVITSVRCFFCRQQIWHADYCGGVLPGKNNLTIFIRPASGMAAGAAVSPYDIPTMFVSQL